MRFWFHNTINMTSACSAIQLWGDLGGKFLPPDLATVNNLYLDRCMMVIQIRIVSTRYVNILTLRSVSRRTIWFLSTNVWLAG